MRHDRVSTQGERCRVLTFEIQRLGTTFEFLTGVGSEPVC